MIKIHGFAVINQEGIFSLSRGDSSSRFTPFKLADLDDWDRQRWKIAIHRQAKNAINSARFHEGAKAVAVTITIDENAPLEELETEFID